MVSKLIRNKVKIKMQHPKRKLSVLETERRMIEPAEYEKDGTTYLRESAGKGLGLFANQKILKSNSPLSLLK